MFENCFTVLFCTGRGRGEDEKGHKNLKGVKRIMENPTH